MPYIPTDPDLFTRLGIYAVNGLQQATSMILGYFHSYIPLQSRELIQAHFHI